MHPRRLLFASGLLMSDAAFLILRLSMMRPAYLALLPVAGPRRKIHHHPEVGGLQ
jgi:hypothetical protein